MMEQRPQADLSSLMDSMKTAADRIVDELGGSFDHLALQIFHAMRPRFGPANGWLLNERTAMLERLALKLELDRDALQELDEAQLDGAVDHLEQLEQLSRALDLETRVRPACRSELLWSPAPGFALTIIDPSQRSDWKPTYAGTSAGPPKDPTPACHSLTLFLCLPRPGRASQQLLAREQPGAPVFYTGQLLAFTLQEPQSDDVHPETVLPRISDELPRGGLVFRPPDKAVSRLQQQLEQEPRASQGILSVPAAHPPPDNLPRLGGWCALLWIEDAGDTMEHHLLFP